MRNLIYSIINFITSMMFTAFAMNAKSCFESDLRFAIRDNKLNDLSYQNHYVEIACFVVAIAFIVLMIWNIYKAYKANK